MFLPRKWALGLGLLVAAPSLTMAGPLDFLNGKSNTATQAPERGNQEVASDIAAALGKEKLVYKDVEIEFLSGVATIKGQIQNASQRALVTRVVSNVPGVKTVQNELSLMEAEATPADPSENALTTADVKSEAAQKAAALHEAAAAPVRHANHTGPQNKQVQRVSHEVAAPAMSNQQVAQNIADALTSAGLSSFDIEIRYKAGVASLIGSVNDKEQVLRAHQAASQVPGVNQVLNKLTVNGQPVNLPQTAGYPQGMPAHPQVQSPAPGQPPYGVAPAGYGMPAPQMAQAGYPAGPQGHPAAQGAYPPPGSQAFAIQQAQAVMRQGMGPAGPIPQYGNVQQAGHHLYNQPHLPNYAWPSYAAYDNSAAISYPTQYDASAYPYIGPFYPYPQVPMDWRKSVLEWDDGYWSLKFEDRTDKWWWFLNPHNWH